MKALCIAGADNTTLANIAAHFYRAGMQLPKPLRREQEITFASWHQTVNSSLASGQSIGRLWEAVATDLVLANLESDCWGWYESISVDALDFWASLEPNIHFLLVCIRPEQVLRNEMNLTEQSAQAHLWLEKWHQRHQRMLDFYLKYPERCLLVDAEDVGANINEQLAFAQKHWQFPLDPEPVDDPESIGDKLELKPRSKQSGDAIASLLMLELVKHAKRDIVGLYTELTAAQYSFSSSDKDLAASRGLLSWSRDDVSPQMLQSLLVEYQQMHGVVNTSKQLLTLQHQQTNIAKKLEDSQQEKETLLTLLHQVQEELEHYFIAHQKLEEEIYGLRESIAKNSEPQSPEYQSAEVRLIKNKNVEWTLSGIKHGISDASKVRVSSYRKFLSSGFVIKSLSGDQWTLSTQAKPFQYTQYQWAMALKLPRLLKSVLEASDLPSKVRKCWHLELSKLESHLLNLPPRVLYSGITLTREVVNDNYEHLMITLDDVFFGEKAAARWSFALSCSEIIADNFGQQPKLEIPNQEIQMLDTWFAESKDDFNEKLELRFALPNAIDFKVWNKLSKSDQHFLKCLMLEMSSILKHLQEQGTKIGRDWQDWSMLSQNIQKILIAKTGKK